MSHSSHISCLSGSCLPPHMWQAHMRQSFRSSSLQCLQEGPLFPASREAGDGISSGSAPPPHPPPHHTQHGGALQCLREGLLFPGCGLGCQLKHDSHPCTNPQPSTEGLDQNSLLIGFSTMGFPSPGRSILKTSSTNTIRQSLRESPLRENGPVRTTSGWSHRRPQKPRPLGGVLRAHEWL